jgi:hypothetical protein
LGSKERTIKPNGRSFAADLVANDKEKANRTGSISAENISNTNMMDSVGKITLNNLIAKVLCSLTDSISEVRQ